MTSVSPIETARIVACCLLVVVSLSAASAAPARRATFANPLDLPYRFSLDAPSRREAADPTVVFYRGQWWLFASKSGGYWHTTDFAH